MKNYAIRPAGEKAVTPFDPVNAIRPVTAIPVKKDWVQLVASDNLYAGGLAALQKTADALSGLPDSKKKHPFIEIHDQDIMISMDENAPLIVENFHKRQVNINHGKSPVLKGASVNSLPVVILPKPAKWRLPSQKEAQALFCKQEAHKNFYIEPKSGAHTFKEKTGLKWSDDVLKGIALNGGQYYNWRDNVCRNFSTFSPEIVASVHILSTSGCSIPEVLLWNAWIPEGMKDQAEGIKEIAQLLQQKLVSLKKTKDGLKLCGTPELEKKVKNGNIRMLSGVDFSLDAVSRQSEQEEGEISLPEVKLADALQEILSRDLTRANITPYTPMLLEGVNRGSWELWDMEDTPGCVMAKTPRTLYARDPRMDIQDGGVVGIDFGTKSTVVVRMEDSTRIQPMRIGMGEYDRELRKTDYENPTVMQFIDIEHFESAYGTGRGRPLTSWADLTVSHTAFNAWNENDSSRDFFSFFGELKQWAGSPGQHIRVRDCKGYELSLPPYETLADGDFDPIERYAYYIGLYINNMHVGRIYMEYLLSFPVTYPQKVRARILESFRKGLRRSLPDTVLRDPACMEQFSVEQGVAEPAAYAVCALQEYGITPQEDESIMYGVFDFGGGTTDFDFGIWRKAKKTGRLQKHRYIIQHFGDGGDPYLGGENLLAMLAFETFKSNLDELRKEKIPFSKPPQCESFPGSGILVVDSQEARSNMRKLMEALRPLWERHPGYEERYADGMIKLQLFRQDGSAADGFELKVDTEMLESILRAQIQKCVSEFFDALLAVFRGDAYQKANPGRTNGQIHLFLAGNSSKSDILKETFQKTMEAYNQQYNDILERDGITPEDGEDSHFKLFYPLGTEESRAQMKGLGIPEDSRAEEERPSGKTGVAIGLVQCRRGSKIKVVSDTPASEEIRFRYWVGDDEDGWFEPVLSRESVYGQWVEYQYADDDRFEFYYTSNPSAGLARRLRIGETKLAHLRIPREAVNEDWVIYLRPSGPNTLEYVVAESQEDANAGNYRSEIRQFLITKG